MSTSLIKTNDKEILTSKNMYKNLFIIKLVLDIIPQNNN